MRTKMKELEKNTLYSFEGSFVRFGAYEKRQHAKGHLGKRITCPTMLLKNVRLKDGQVVTDHAWLNVPHNQMYHFQKGNTVYFTAYIEPYIKGCWRNHNGPDKKLELDYKFDYINVLAIS